MCVCVCVTENQPLKAAGIFIIIIIICYVMLCVFRFATLVRSLLLSTLGLLFRCRCCRFTFIYIVRCSWLRSRRRCRRRSQRLLLTFCYFITRSHEQQQRRRRQRRRRRRFASFAFTRFYFTFPLRFTRYVTLNVTLNAFYLYFVCASHFVFILIPHALLLL